MDFLAPPPWRRSPLEAMPLRSYRTKRWLSEAQIERWFPPLGGERNCFDANPITSPTATTRSPHRPVNAVAIDAELTCTHSPNCYANAGYRDHDRRCSVDLRLDIPTHRKEIQTPPAPCPAPEFT